MEDKLKNQIKSLGVKEGDILFITADLLQVGYYSGDREKTLSKWLSILVDLVGVSGTLIIPAYTQVFFRFKRDQSIIFEKESVTTSGALSVGFSMYPEVIRSKHPTNSCFGIGKYAAEILSDHDHTKSAYWPYHKIISLGGKHLLLGCANDSRLGVMTIHAAQELLGINKRRWQNGLFQTYYKTLSGEVKLFTKRDFGGCTSYGHKIIGYHVINNAITFGKTGRGLSALVDTKKSLDIVLELFRKDKCLFRCDDHDCADCHGKTFLGSPFFWLKRAFIFFFRYFKNRSFLTD
jgi:aminoglycoside 3-N-acetyltransferase